MMKMLVTGRIPKEELNELNKYFKLIYTEDEFTRKEVLEKIEKIKNS